MGKFIFKKLVVGGAFYCIFSLISINVIYGKNFQINDNYINNSDNLSIVNVICKDSINYFNFNQKIWSSVDGGINWRQWDFGYIIHSGEYFIDLDATQDSSFYILTNFNRGCFYKIRDFGETIDTIAIPDTNDIIMSFSMKSKMESLVAIRNKTNDTAQILKTSDGGISWQEAGFPKNLYPKFYIYSINSKNDSLYAFLSVIPEDSQQKQETKLMYSFDNGLNWMGPYNFPIFLDLRKQYHRFQVIDSNIWIVSYGISNNETHSIIYYSSNNGMNWDIIFKDSIKGKSFQINNISMYDAKIGVAASVNQVIYTEDGGKSWIPIIEQDTNFIQYAYFQEPNHVLLFGINNIRELIFLPSGVNDLLEEQAIIKVAPNPASDMVEINVQPEWVDKISSIELIDNLGTAVLSQGFSFQNIQYNFNVSNLASGSYFMKIRIEDKLYVSKIIIQH